jgi:hypothetical protein
MTRKVTFGSTFGDPSPPNQEAHEIALSEVQQLIDSLSITSRGAASILPYILGVRMVIRKADYNNKSLPTVDEAEPRPAAWFLLNRHTVLPNEWPWYSAHDLNTESLLLWQ